MKRSEASWRQYAVRLSSGLLVVLLIVFAAQELKKNFDKFTTARSDNLHFNVRQLEVEFRRFEIELLKLANGLSETGETARLTFDILYNRLSVLRGGTNYAVLSGYEGFEAGLASFQEFLDASAPVIDSGDEVLKQRSLELAIQTSDFAPNIQKLTMDLLIVLSKATDEQRYAVLASLFKLATIIAILLVGLIVLIFNFQRAQKIATEQQQAAELARKRTDIVISNSIDAIMVSDEDGNICDWNPAAEEMFCYSFSKNSDNPTSITTFLNYKSEPSENEPAHIALKRLFASEGQGRHAMELRRASGEIFSAEIVIQHAETERQKMFIVFLRDITSEEKLERERAEVQEIVDAFLSAGPVYYVLEDSSYRIRAISEAAARDFVGLPVDLILGKDFADLGVEDRDEVEKRRRTEAKALEKDGTCTIEFSRPLISGGPLRHFRTHVKKVPRSNGNHYFSLVTEDVSELVEKQSELEAASERQKKLFAIIGHELRTPAAALSMLIDQTKSQVSKETFRKLKITSGQLLDVLDDLRFIVRPERLREAKLQIVDPVVVASESIRSLEDYLSSVGINLEIDLSGAFGFNCEMDVKALRHLLGNLLRNAAIHSNATRVLVKMTVQTLSESKVTFQLSVEDNGVGIDETHVAHLFDEFYRVDAEKDGTGLGLAICREMAKQLSGQIEYFDSDLGGAGFLIILELPRVMDFIPAEETPVTYDPIKGKKVLYAEDSLIMRTVTEKLLESAGAIVTTALDGEKALELASQKHFDLVITDIFMPNLDGYGLAAGLRSAGFKGPIIGVTAATVGDEIDKLLAAGANEVIGKPLNIDAVRTKLRLLHAV